MTENKISPTKTLFNELSKLYKQGQLLLMDADRLMGERGWEPMNTRAPAEFSYSLSSPERWYARWAVRFYMPGNRKNDTPFINRILFIGIHFASDAKSGVPSEVNEPLACAGRLLYEKPMTPKSAEKHYDYYMVKYCFYGDPHESLENWRRTGQSHYSENLKGSETFTVPLYEITSGEQLKLLLVDPLLKAHEIAEQND